MSTSDSIHEVHFRVRDGEDPLPYISIEDMKAAIFMVYKAGFADGRAGKDFDEDRDTTFDAVFEEAMRLTEKR